VLSTPACGTVAPSGELNAGNVSVSGQRETANGFFVNGGDVQEHMNGGTSVVPNLDSIDEFLVLTNNFDPQYGNYNGGIVSVITKSGSDAFHGDVFDFVRNTALDAKNYFSPGPATFVQQQPGGTIGGPAKKGKVFFFADYQGTRTTQGIETGVIPVPSLAEGIRRRPDGSLAEVTLTFPAAGVPALGRRSYRLAPVDVPAGPAWEEVPGTVMENPAPQVHADPAAGGTVTVTAVVRITRPAVSRIR